MVVFPTLEQTKLSSILERLQPEVRQVQDDVANISSRYRNDLDTQLQSSLEFEKHLARNYTKINKKFKRTLICAEELNVELNKKLDSLKDHDELQSLTEEVMGKLLNVVSTLETYCDGIDRSRFPLLSKVMHKGDSESFEQVDHCDLEGYDERSEEEPRDLGASGHTEQTPLATQNETTKSEESEELEEFAVDYSESERFTLDSRDPVNKFEDAINGFDIFQNDNELRREILEDLSISQDADGTTQAQKPDRVGEINAVDDDEEEDVRDNAIEDNRDPRETSDGNNTDSSESPDVSKQDLTPESEAVASEVTETVKYSGSDKSGVEEGELSIVEQSREENSTKVGLVSAGSERPTEGNSETNKAEKSNHLPLAITEVTSTPSSLKSISPPIERTSPDELASIEDAITRYKSSKLLRIPGPPLPSPSAASTTSSESTETLQIQARGHITSRPSTSSTRLSDNLKKFI